MEIEDSNIAQAKAENEALLETADSLKNRRRSDRKRRRKYKFSDKRHPKRSIAAALMVIPEAAFIVISVIISTSLQGRGGVIVGVLPFIALIMSSIGIILCATTFRKADFIYTFSWIGLIASMVIWIFVAVLVVAGL